MKWLLVFLSLIGSTVIAQQAQPLTLADAIRLGREHSKALRISELKLDAATAKASEARSAMLPSLKFEGSYKRLSDVDAFAVQVPFSPTPIVISPTVLTNYNLRVGLQQPLFTGFRLRSNVRAAEYLEEATDAERRGSESDLILNITSAYWMLYQAMETRKLVDENVDRLSSYQSDTENLMKAGMATRNDLLRIQVQLSSAKLSQIDAANDVEVATMNLNNLMGQPIEAGVSLASAPAVSVDPEEVSGTPSTVLVDQALKSRPDLLAMQSRVEAAKAGVTSARGNWWPQIALAANYMYSRPNPRYLPAKDEFKPTWEVGVVMQFDIWNWGATHFQAEQATSQLQQTEYAFSQMKDNATLEVRRYQLGVKRAVERITVAHESIGQAEENSRSTNEKYRNGLATSTELLDASVAVLQARTTYTGALVEHEIAVARLNKAVGQ